MKTLEENNKLVADFMGMKSDEGFYYGYELKKAGIPFNIGAGGNGTRWLKFDESWDWLMPVCNKIDYNLTMKNGDYFQTSIGKHQTSIFRKDRLSIPYLKEEIVGVGESKIEATYKAVIGFINWYNSNETNTLQP